MEISRQINVSIIKMHDKYGVSAGKRDQIDKKFFFEIINVLDQMIKSTSILLKNFFLKKISIWSLFPALTPYSSNKVQRIEVTCDKIKLTLVSLKSLFS